MICSFGVKRQPRTTVPLRLTEMHMVVVWTWGQKKKKHQCSKENISEQNHTHYPVKVLFPAGEGMAKQHVILNYKTHNLL